MRCPACGYVSLDRLETCKHCGAPMAATASPQALRSGEDRSALIEIGEGELVEWLERPEDTPPEPDGGGGDFRIDDDLMEPGAELVLHERPEPVPAGFKDFFWGPSEPESPQGPRAFSLDLDHGSPADPQERGPIIDHDELVPDGFWAPRSAGFGRRAAALAVDLALFASALGLFLLGALLALRSRGFDTELLFAPPGRQAALVPFALLALLVSFAYSVFFHAGTGQTPGKRLAGLAVVSGDGSPPSTVAVVVRWLAAVLGLAVAGIGVAWALFEPRRRGWADLWSRTLIAGRRRGPDEPPASVPASVDKPWGRGYHASAEDGPR